MIKDMDLAFRRLPSFSLLQHESIRLLSRGEICYLLQKFDLEEIVEEDGDIGDLQDTLFAFTSSYDGHNSDIFHKLYETSVIFPNVEFEIVQSLLDSAEGSLSQEMIEEFAELEGDVDGNGIGSRVVAISLGQLLEKKKNDGEHWHYTLDRGTVLVITDDSSVELKSNPSTSPSNFNFRRVTSVSLPNGSACGIHALYSMQGLSHIARQPYLEWGLHDVHVRYSTAVTASTVTTTMCSATKQLYVTSVVFDYSLCLERVFDLFHYGWTAAGGGWTEALEGAMLQLLVAVDDDLVDLVRSWTGMMSAFESMGGEGQSQSRGMCCDLESMLAMVQGDASDALRTHSANAIGRLHQVLTQFSELSSGPMGAMVNVPILFLHCIENFVLVTAGKDYLQHLKTLNFDSAKIQDLDAFLTLYSAKLPIIKDFSSVSDEERELIEEFFFSLTPSDVKALERLKPSQMDGLLGGQSHFNADTMCYLPTLSLRDISDPAALARAVTSLAEKTFNDAIIIGSGSADATNLHSSPASLTLGGYTMTPQNRGMTCAILSSLLDAGVGYVATKDTAKLMGHLPMWRSALQLQPTAPHAFTFQLYLGDYKHFFSSLPLPLKKRIKDMKRIFRNKIKKKLSFRLNSDVNHAIVLLREHHGAECWVGQELEEVWKVMAATSPPQLMVFELYYGSTLVAADFVHPVCGGRAVYVATRFSARGHSVNATATATATGTASNASACASEGVEHCTTSEEDQADIRTMQPGFILALLECRWLQLRGCHLWDLGGYNSSPLMQYKLDLAGEPVLRPHALYTLRNISRIGGNDQEVCNRSGCDSGQECARDVADGASAPSGGGLESLFSTLLSGNTLVEDVRLSDLMGHSSATCV